MKNNRLFLIVSFLVMVFVSFGQTDSVTSSDYVYDLGSPGAQCAVKKAHQMTDVEFVPLRTIVANTRKIYQPGENSKGMIYSSVKEINTGVGFDVSFHTFMTAMHNPRSVLYTVNLSKPPYHGKNASAYYGTVCSALVSYALGLSVVRNTQDFSQSDDMVLVDNQSIKNIQLADVLLSSNHIVIITGIKRNSKTGSVVSVEYCEAVQEGCRRVVKTAKEFNQKLSNGKWKMFRYKDLEKNTYTPLTEFVAVDGEQGEPFKYNDALCPNKGDKSCYVSGEDVVLNILGDGFEKVVLYKYSKKYNTIELNGDSDIVLKNLPYGDYKAMLERKGEKTDFVCWKVIDVRVKADPEKETISFHSDNATPVYLEFCMITGSRPSWAWYPLKKEDISKGYVKISDLPLSDTLRAQESAMYAKVHFDCEYGKVINKPILWNKDSKNTNAND